MSQQCHSVRRLATVMPKVFSIQPDWVGMIWVEFCKLFLEGQFGETHFVAHPPVILLNELGPCAHEAVLRSLPPLYSACR